MSTGTELRGNNSFLLVIFISGQDCDKHLRQTNYYVNNYFVYLEYYFWLCQHAAVIS